MIHQIPTETENLSIFEVSGKVSAENYKNIILPALDIQQKKFKKINLVYILNTDLKNYSSGALFEDALTGMKFLTSLNRVALVSNHETINNLLEFFSKLLPGTYRGFPLNQKEEAITWAKSNV